MSVLRPPEENGRSARKPALGFGSPSRRDFLCTAVAGAATAVVPGLLLGAENAKGPNQTLGVGVIGTGGRSEAHLNILSNLQKQGRLRVTALCDVYRPRVEAAAKRYGGKVYRKHEDLLADPNVDAVCIATPDRHHAPQAIDAVRAGKDVFVEKPLTHWAQFDLARQLAEETQKHKRIVQVGTQYMADDAYVKAHDLLAGGAIGKIVQMQAGFFRRGDWGERMPIPDPKAKPGPELDWERFLGDAPKVPYTVSRFFQWRLYLDYAGGPCTDLLVHTFTPLFRLAGLDYPQRVFGGGGVFQYDREVPDTFNMMIDYPEGPSVVLMNTLSNFTGCQTIVRGTDGALTFKPGGMEITPHDAKRPAHIIRWKKGVDLTEALWLDFLECISSREQPLSSVTIGAKVQAPLCMAMLGYLNNKVVHFDPQKNEFVLH